MGASIANDRKLAALDLLRFACAMLVILYHFGSAYALSPSETAYRAFADVGASAALAPLTWFGWIGVELFFVISGYVIARSALGSSPRQFLRRRLLRLAPAAWICACISAIVFLAADLYGPRTILERWSASVLFLPWMSQIDGSYWTLGIEVNFYLLVAVCLRFGGSRTLIGLAKFLAFASAAYWAFRWAEGNFAISSPFPHGMLLLPHGCFFALGMLIEHRARTSAALSPIAFPIALAGCAAEIASHTAERTAALHLTSSPLVPAALFVAGLLLIVNAGRIRIDERWTAATAMLGLMTYPLYLLHQDAGAAIMATTMRAGAGFPAAFAATMVAALGTAFLCTRNAEPALRQRIAKAIDQIGGSSTGSRPAAVDGA